MRKSGRKVMLLMLVSSIMTMFGVAGDVIGSGRAAAAESDFSGGNGTIDSPYLVGNADQLARLGSSRYVDRRYYFKQIADIDLSSHGNWTPIGSTNIPMGRFEGHLDGNGFRITGLTISGGDHAGLFSTIGGSTYSPSSMTNVRLDHVNVTGNDYVGGLAGELSSVTVNNCIVTGNVTGVDDVGGLTGWLDGTINDSAASVNVTGSHYHTGGLVGVNSGTINGSYASGRVSGGAIATGGLAGQQYSGSINNSYASGSVSGNSQVGGLIGIQDGGSIGNSYA